MSATHIITRPFEGPAGRQFKSGEAVDASEWRNTTLLVEQRRMRPITTAEAKRLESKPEQKPGKR